MKVEMINPVKLIEYDNNPRLNDDAVGYVAESIKAYGFKQPIVVDKENVIIAGHTRKRAAMELGLDNVPVIRADDLTDDQVKAYRLADNKVAEFSTWDNELLDSELELIEMNMDVFGFDTETISLDSYKDLEFEEYEDNETSDDDVEVVKEIYSYDEIISDAFNYYREHGFPFPQLSLFEMKQQINKISNLPTEKLPKSNVGYKVADTYHKHRFEGSAIGMRSPLQSFDIDKSLTKALKMDYPNIKKDAINFIYLVNGTQANANFRPAFCKYILDVYGNKGKKYLDPCMGYGGRFVGFLASDFETYVGTDPSTKSFESNQRMKDDLITKDKKAHMYNEPFEELDLSEYENNVDIVFTSPPYFNKEVYAEDEETQSANKFKEYDDWKENFLKALIKKAHTCLKDDCYFVLNIEDITDKNNRIDLVNDSVNLAQKIGFQYIKREEFIMQKRTMVKDGKKVSQDGIESVLIFRK